LKFDKISYLKIQN